MECTGQRIIVFLSHCKHIFTAVYILRKLSWFRKLLKDVVSMNIATRCNSENNVIIVHYWKLRFQFPERYWMVMFRDSENSYVTAPLLLWVFTTFHFLWIIICLVNIVFLNQCFCPVHSIAKYCVALLFCYLRFTAHNTIFCHMITELFLQCSHLFKLSLLRKVSFVWKPILDAESIHPWQSLTLTHTRMVVIRGKECVTP